MIIHSSARAASGYWEVVVSSYFHLRTTSSESKERFPESLGISLAFTVETAESDKRQDVAECTNSWI